MPVGTAKFDLNRFNESTPRGEKPDFWPVSKNNTGSLPLRGILPVTRNSVIAEKRVTHFCKRNGVADLNTRSVLKDVGINTGEHQKIGER